MTSGPSPLEEGGWRTCSSQGVGTRPAQGHGPLLTGHAFTGKWCISQRVKFVSSLEAQTSRTVREAQHLFNAKLVVTTGTANPSSASAAATAGPESSPGREAAPVPTRGPAPKRVSRTHTRSLPEKARGLVSGRGDDALQQQDSDGVCVVVACGLAVRATGACGTAVHKHTACHQTPTHRPGDLMKTGRKGENQERELGDRAVGGEPLIRLRTQT